MKIDESVYIAEGVRLDGSGIEIAKDSSVWFNTVIRTVEGEKVSIGERTNIQDLSMIHTDKGFPVTIGSDVTVGHMCLLHGCTIGDNTLIGMGSLVMNGAVIGPNSIVGAGSLVTEGKTIPEGSLAFGRPAKVVRQLSEEEIEGIRKTAAHYVEEKQGR